MNLKLIQRRMHGDENEWYVISPGVVGYLCLVTVGDVANSPKRFAFSPAHGEKPQSSEGAVQSCAALPPPPDVASNRSASNDSSATELLIRAWVADNEPADERTIGSGSTCDAEPLEKTSWDGVVARFWKTFGMRVPSDARVFALGSISPTSLRTVRGRMIENAPPEGTSWVFFIDLIPGANWAHRCAYAFLAVTDDTAWWCDATWPPDRPVGELEELARPVSV